MSLYIKIRQAFSPFRDKLRRGTVGPFIGPELCVVKTRAIMRAFQRRFCSLLFIRNGVLSVKRHCEAFTEAFTFCNPRTAYGSMLFALVCTHRENHLLKP